MRFFGSPSSCARAAEAERRLHHGLVHHRARIARRFRLRILIHQPREQLLVERAPVGADAHRLIVLERHLDDGGELLVLLVLEADIAGIDAVLVERLRAARMIGEKLVADVMKVADERHRYAKLEQPLLDARHCCGRLVAIDRDAHELGAGPRPTQPPAMRSLRHRRCRYWSSTARRSAPRHRQ